MSDATKIAAVVVTYNRQARLRECMRAILSQTHGVDAIIVIDNASTDETPTLFQCGSEFDLPIVRYERMSQNAGGAGGFKHGMHIATQDGFDWCWIMDDDVIPDQDAVEHLIKADDYLRAHGVSPSFLASSVFGTNGEVMNVPNLSRHLSTNGYPDWGEHLAQALVRIESATFVSLLIPTRAIQMVGLPIADYFMWGDDSEYTRRLTTYVGPAYVSGLSKVTHVRSIAQPISVVEERNAQRIAHHRRATRNALLNTSHYGGRVPILLQLARNSRDCVRIILRRDGLTRTKLHSIAGGTLDFLARRYDLEDLNMLKDSPRKNF